jgi:nitrate reductase NapD
MNICSLVVHARPDRLGAVQSGLEGIPGVEVHGRSDEGKFVVTAEDVEGALANDAMTAIQNLDGVVNAVLIYHYGGEEPLEEEIIRESH